MTTSSVYVRDGELIVGVQQALATLQEAMESDEWDRISELNQSLHAAISQAVEGVATAEAQQALKLLLEQCQAFYGELIQRGTQYRDGLAKEIQATKRGVSAANAYLKTSIG